MTSIELDVQMLPPSPNQRKQHWAKTHRQRKEAHVAVWAAWNQAGKPLADNRPALLDIIIHAHGVPGDEDNQWARCKGLQDGLVKVGALVDDSPRWLTLGSIRHEKAPPRRGHITIRITYHDHEEAVS